MLRIIFCLTVVLLQEAQAEDDWSAQIHKGKQPPEGKFPYVVWLYGCTGAILNEDTIITAAHCFKSTKPGRQVYVGHVSLKNEDKDYIFKAKSIHRHPDYDNAAKYVVGYDIALMKLERKIDFSKLKNVAPVCLPRPTDVPDSSKCIAMGWGETGENGRYNKTLRWIPYPLMAGCGKFPLPPPQKLAFCAGYPSGGPKGEGTCSGDSGGPFMCPLKGKPDVWLQYGVDAARTASKCGKGPTYYARTSAYLDWIQKIAES